MEEVYSLSTVADLLSVSKETVRRWENSGKLKAKRRPNSNYRYYLKEDLRQFDQLEYLFRPSNDEAEQPKTDYHTIELFAGAGGMALGWEAAGLKNVLLNDFDKYCCATLKRNRPDWNIIEGDVSFIDYAAVKEDVDVVTGGFPCQAFSYAGKKLGFEDTRGTLFYEFARAVKATTPKICVAENVRGLLNHNNGETIAAMQKVLGDIGYNVLSPRVLKAINYRVPQKRERLFLIGIRKDLDEKSFNFPYPYHKTYSVKDALRKSDLFDCDVPKSDGQTYPKRKKEILSMVPQGGYWRDLPHDIQKEYMKKSLFLGGGKTGMARRMSWDEPSLTLTCAPAQKQTERCHPEETRPFTVREYARIQTFPDDWQFAGSITQQYKQIGNAVPVNLAKAMGEEIIKFLNRC